MRPLLSETAKQQRWRAVTPYLTGDVLDIGCGWTTLPNRLTSQQAYVGVDINPAALHNCAVRYPQHVFIQKDLETEALDLGNRRFDTILMTAVIEHLHAPDRVLLESGMYLKQKGRLVLTTPSPFGDVVHRIGSRLGLFYIEAVVEHVRIFDYRALAHLVRGSGFDLVVYRRFLLGMNQLVVCRLASSE